MKAIARLATAVAAGAVTPAAAAVVMPAAAAVTVRDGPGLHVVKAQALDSRLEFRLAGSGSATVLTPARYTPGVRYQVAIRWRTGARRVVERSLPDGQLRIEVPLGPSDTVQEYPNDGPPVGTTVYTTRVTITRLRG